VGNLLEFQHLFDLSAGYGKQVMGTHGLWKCLLCPHPITTKGPLAWVLLIICALHGWENPDRWWEMVPHFQTHMGNAGNLRIGRYLLNLT
jgi:hypothetical protein